MNINVDLVIPFDVEIIKPSEAMREHCPIAIWPKICDLNYASYPGIWTVVGTASSELWGAHFLVVQSGRIAVLMPVAVCRTLSVPARRIQVCPICNGLGHVTCPLPEGLTSNSPYWRKTCYGCDGKGWI